MQGPYKRSKFLAEQVALEFAEEGFPVVIVNPTAPVGDHDFKPTPTGKIVVDFVRGAIPAYVDTGLNVVDVRDVACGHLAACEQGVPGERYILGSENLTLQQILETLAGILGRKAPSVQIPYARRICGGSRIHRLGGGDRERAARASGRRAHVAKEDVGASRQGRARTGVFPRASGGCPAPRCSLVSGERLLLRAWIQQ